MSDPNIKATLQIIPEATKALEMIRSLKKELSELRAVEAAASAGKAASEQEQADTKRVKALRDQVEQLKQKNAQLAEGVKLERKLAAEVKADGREFEKLDKLRMKAEADMRKVEQKARDDALKAMKQSNAKMLAEAKADGREFEKLDKLRAKAEADMRKVEQKARDDAFKALKRANDVENQELRRFLASKKAYEQEAAKLAKAAEATADKSQRELLAQQIKDRKAANAKMLAEVKADGREFEKLDKLRVKAEADMRNAEQRIRDDAYKALKRANDAENQEMRRFLASQRAYANEQAAMERARLREQVGVNRRGAAVDYFRAVSSDRYLPTSKLQDLAQRSSLLSPSQQVRLEKMIDSRGLGKRFLSLGKEAGENFGAGFKSFFGGGLATLLTAAGLTKLGTDIFKVSSQLKTLELQMRGIYGDAGVAKKQYDTLIKQTQQYGADPTRFGSAYVKFAAGAKGAGFSEEDINKGVDSLLKLKTALNMDEVALQNTSKALSDMLAKGTVQAEELKGQLADHIPNAIGLAAKASGVSTKEMFKAMESGAVDSATFVRLMLIQIAEEYEKGAKEAMNAPQTAVNRLVTQLKLAAKEVGEGGFLQAVSDIANDIRAKLADPAALAQLKQMGKSLGEFVKWAYEGIKAVAGWVSENKEWLSTLGKVIGLLMTIRLAFGAIAFAVSPATFAVKVLAKMFDGTLIESVGKAQKALIAFLMSTQTRLATVGLSVKALAMSLGAVATAAMAVYGITVQRENFKNAEGSYDKVTGGVRNLSDEELAKAKATLTDKRGSIGNSVVGSTMNFLTGGMSEGTQNQQIDTALKAIEIEERRRAQQAAMKAKADEAAKKAQEAQAAADRATEKAALQGQLKDGIAKHKNGKKGKGAGGGGGDGGVLGARLDDASKDYGLEESQLKEQLESFQISIADYFDKLRASRQEEYKAKEAALTAALKKAKTPDQKEAIRQRLDTLKTVDEKNQVDLNREQVKVERQYAKEVLEVREQLERSSKEVAQARLTEIERKYEDLLAKMKANGDVAGQELVRKLINVEQARARMNELQRVSEDAEQAYEVKRLEVQQLEKNGLLGRIEATEQLRKLQNEQSYAAIEALERQLELIKDIQGMEADRLELQKKILLEKQKVVETSQLERDVGDALTRGFEGAAQDLMKGNVKGMFKNFMSSLVNDLQSSISKSVSESLMSTLTQIFSQAGGSGGGGGGKKGGGLFSTLLNIGMGYMTGGPTGAMASLFSSAAGEMVPGGMSMMPGASTTDILQSALSSGSGSGGVGGMSVMGAAAPFIMNISTPDANSFRASSSQLRFETQTGLQRAAARG